MKFFDDFSSDQKLGLILAIMAFILIALITLTNDPKYAL